MLNIYKTKAMKKYIKTDYEMGGIDDHNIEFPKHLLVCSGTGGGKTNWLLNYLQLSAQGSGTFGHITIVCKQIEPAYEMLQESLKDKFTLHTSLSELPKLNDFGNKDCQQLLVLDDCVANKDQSKIEEYFLRGRKYGAGVQCIYISQSYFKTPIFIRNQISYLILLTLSSDRNLNMIMNEYSMGIDKEILIKIFKNAVKERLCCFKINIANPNLNEKFSRNFTDFYRLVDDENELIPIDKIELFQNGGLLN